MKKKVSIIIPVYNGEQYLSRCIEGLLMQTYKNIEILLIDDGSTDGSARACDNFADREDRIRVIHMDNAGVSAARNRGMEECDGEYVTFVDVDDYPAIDMVEHLVAIIEETKCDVAGCEYHEFGNDSPNVGIKDMTRQKECENTKAAITESRVEVLTGDEFIERGILDSDTRCWSKLYKRESVGAFRFDTGLTIGEDMLFLLRIAEAGKRFCRSRYKGYGYYVNDKGAMLSDFKDSYMDQIICWQRARESIAERRPELGSKAAAIVMISTMLVAGKLAMLPRRERKEKEKYVQHCSDVIEKYGKDKDAYRRLDRGYRIKVAVYRYVPHLYMGMYHCMKWEELSCRKIN